ncbi:MAG: S8 family serine peptidase [Devosia sp.]|uniref:S8 family serine peptidase n=1 Tax=Devosia sp. TaxID=1871048 RepID=UPI0033943F0F
MSSPTTSLRALLVALGLVAVPGLLASPLLVAPAYAQDDDDDDGGDDDDDWDSGSSDDDDDDDEPWMGGRIVRRPAPVAVPLPEQADDQVVVASLDAAGRDVLLAAGFLIVSESSGRLLLELPDDLDVEAALAAVRKASPEALVAPNSYYRSQAVPIGCEGAMCEHWEAVDWPPVSVGATCVFAPHIGVIDTGVNLDHPMLSEARLTLETIGNVDAEPSELKHGTAVVAMFVGSGRVPGLAPAAEVLVVDPFGRVGQDERSDVFALVEALDRLATAQVDVASLSLAGPDNAILADAISRIQTAGIPVVAAVGNAGPRAEAMFPAAYPDVVAVTAVDRRQNIYRRAVQGEHVSFAAPGVDISTAASISGIRPQTGTSFAVPFVTTALAAALAKGVEPPAAMDALIEASLDLGEPGRDAIFGWGLVRIPSPC